jgi:acyl carrier protein
MNPSPRALVHQLLASRFHIEEASIRDADLLDELRVTPLDLLLVVLWLDRLDHIDCEFPLHALEHANTVGDLVDLVEPWLQKEAAPTSYAQVSGL